MCSSDLVCAAGGSGGGEVDRADVGFDFLASDGAGAEKEGARAGEGENGGFDADDGGASVKDHVDGVAEAGTDVFGASGGEGGEAVGGGGGDGNAGSMDESEGDGMSGHAKADGGEASGGVIGDGRGFGEDECERAGPKPVDEACSGFGPIGGEGAGLFGRFDVDDERGARGAALGFVDPADGDGIESVGAEAVDGFGGEGDEAAGAKERGRLGDLVVAGQGLLREVVLGIAGGLAGFLPDEPGVDQGIDIAIKDAVDIADGEA